MHLNANAHLNTPAMLAMLSEHSPRVSRISIWRPSEYLPGLGQIKMIIGCTEPFLSTLQNMGVKSLQGVENFQQGEVLFVQAAYKFLHAAKMHFMQL